MRCQRGYSIFEVMIVVLILGITATIAIPKFKDYRDRQAQDGVEQKLESAWEVAQEYYRGERGAGQEQLTSWSGFDDFSKDEVPADNKADVATRLDSRFNWLPPSSANIGGFVPSDSRSNDVLIYRAADQALVLCVAGPLGVMCKAEDGLKATWDGQERLGPRYGFAAAGSGGGAMGDPRPAATRAAEALSCAPTVHAARKAGPGSCPGYTLGSGSAIKDKDRDGVADEEDNCPEVSNSDQRNDDGDSVGNVCDSAPFGAPSSASPPSVSGQPAVNQSLDSTPGVWSNATTITRVWQRCNSFDGVEDCTDIPGAIYTSYALTNDDQYWYIRLKEIATNPDGTREMSSNRVGPVVARPLMVVVGGPSGRNTVGWAMMSWENQGGAATTTRCLLRNDYGVVESWTNCGSSKTYNITTTGTNYYFQVEGCNTAGCHGTQRWWFQP